MASSESNIVRIPNGRTRDDRHRGDVPHLPRRLSTAQRRLLAQRLRQQGWSYRHIAEGLRVSYRDVALWLDNGASTARPLRHRVPGITERSEPTSQRHPVRLPAGGIRGDSEEVALLAFEQRRLEARVRELEASQAELQREVVAVEGRLRRALRELAESVTARFARLFKPDTAEPS